MIVGPTAEISAPPRGDEGAPIEFDANASTPGGGATPIVFYDWDFGDGTVTGFGASVTHTFADNGLYTVSLQVTDDQGGTDTATHEITINNMPPSFTDVFVNPRFLPVAGGTSTITITAIDPGAADTFVYSFDCDGDQLFEVGLQTQNFADCTFTEADGGPNTVNVRVEDDDGGVTTGATSVEVGGPPPLPLEPEGRIIDATHTFRWQAVSQEVTTGYRLKVALADAFGNGNFEAPVLVSIIEGPTASEFTTAEPLADGDYQWRVQSLLGDEPLSPFSEPLAFTVDATVREYTVTGHVVLEGREDHDGVRVSFSGREPLMTGADGRFDVRLVTGEYEITIEKDGYLPAVRRSLVVDRDVALSATLLAGDVGGDHIIDVVDVVLPAKNLGKTESPWRADGAAVPTLFVLTSDSLDEVRRRRGDRSGGQLSRSRRLCFASGRWGRGVTRSPRWV